MSEKVDNKDAPKIGAQDSHEENSDLQTDEKTGDTNTRMIRLQEVPKEHSGPIHVETPTNATRVEIPEETQDTPQTSTPTKSSEDLNPTAPTATRNDLQIGRRLFHFATGSTIATLYLLFLDHVQIVYILGSVACILYIVEQIRVNYPEVSGNLVWMNRFFLRAEEQLKESASVPYAMGLLLTILTFPKTCALIGVYTLAVADPLAAIVGIRFGTHKILGHKSIEGSIAFFVAAVSCALFVLNYHHPDLLFPVIVSSILIGTFGTALELIPAKIDDNLTIPLFTATLAWMFIQLFGLPF